jgi:amino acid adenylation domain-containing protein
MSFLDLDCAYNEDSQWQRTQCIVRQDVHTYCQERNWKPSTFFQTVWAIVLNKYTASHGVTFAIHSNEINGGSPMICDVSIEPETSIVDLLADHLTSTTFTTAVPRQFACNTGVVIDRQDGESIESLPPLQIILLASTTSSELWLSCSSDISSSYADSLLSTIEQIIEEILQHPHRAVKDLSLFSIRNSRQVLEWNRRIMPNNMASMVDLIRQHASQRSTHEAICAWDGSLTYAELDSMTTQLAYHLRTMGIGENDKVLLGFEKSMYAIVAFLSILKAGAIFVPVSPAYPVERMQAIIDATHPRLALTSPESTPVFERHQVPALGLNQSFIANLSIKEDEDPLPSSDPQRVAYILFTSGSTGRPKGCVIEHQAMATMISQGPPFRIYPSSRVLQVAPIIFAASSVDMFLPLLTGGTVCIASKHDLMNNLAATMKQLRITWACMTPSAITSVNPLELSGLQTLGLVGEPVSDDLLNKWAPSVDLLSGYGLSEIVGAGCISSLKVDMHPRNIGHSPTAHIWLADPTNINRLTPVGAIGEMLIEGPNLARGYLDDPQKTADTFIEAPEWIQDFYPGRGRRVVRTGDLARYHSDGSIVYVGRKDTQVKIRGKRVELGEVESIIRLHQAPGDMVIVEAAAPLDGDGTPMLIGFIHTSRSSEGGLADSTSLIGLPNQIFREETTRLDLLVRAALPEYMIPSVYMALNRIPKTASGKTDRRALRLEVASMSRQQIEAYHDVGNKPQVRPRTDAEKSVHGLFSQILKRDQDSFGIHDQFIRLGGDSIKAIRLVQLCRKSGLAVNVADIMEPGTVAQLAQMANRLPEPILRSDKRQVEVPSAAVTEHLINFGVAVQEVEAMNPCSSMQDGILISQLKNPQQYALRVLYEARLSSTSSEIDLGRLQTAWQLLVRSHPMLRTIFVTNVTPSVFAVQVQLKSGSIPRIHGINDNLKPGDILDQRRECQPPSALPQFDLHVAPSGRVIIELELSHAVVDGMSMSIIIRDLCRLYGDTSPSLSIFNFADHVEYQRKVSTDDSVSYWKQYLDCMVPSQFPTTSDGSPGTSRESNQTSQFKAVSVDVGPAAEYRKFAQDTGTTVANIVKLAWSLVLHVMCRTDDVCFGYLTTSRDAPIEGALEGVGPLINLLVFRQRLGRESTVAQVLQSIQADFISSLPHKAVSLSDIRRALDFASDEVMFNTCISHFPVTAPDEADDLPILLHEVERQDPTEFDISLEIMESENEIQSSIKAYTGVVSLERMERVAALFEHLMKTLLGKSSRTIGELGVVPEKDCATIGHLNRSITQPPIEQCVHDIILRQCQNRPTAPAICAWDGDWTYGDLDRFSSSLAQQLQSQGVVPEIFVPVLMDKSRWVPIALLGILKAGGAFVLLDPTQPIQRLQDICIDLKPNTILASPEYRATAAALVSSVVVVGNDQSPTLEVAGLDKVPKVAVHPRNAAYAVFTSGSTGKPKGVAIEHRSLCTSAAAMMEHLPLNLDTRMFQYASHAFDVSVLDLTVCLMAGGCLCIPSAEARQNRLTESLNDFSVSLVALTPTVTRTIQPERLTSLKTLKVSGEALSSFDIQRWKSAAPHIQIVNMYGPAECTINVTVQGPIGPTSYPSNIGYPMSSATAWVVDSENHNRLLPMGAVGELVIQGPVVGRGYLNRPEQTAASFIPPPSWLSQFKPVAADDERLYKTGDLVQYAADGSMHYKGRKDFQVKLRGQRLELGEVEAQLRCVFPNASDVIAEVASLNQGKTTALVAFIHQPCWGNNPDLITSSGTGVDDSSFGLLHAPCEAFDQAVAQAKVTLAAALPSYMEPSIYLPLVQIPRSRSGKADRGQLRQIVNTGLHERWTGDASTVTIPQRRPKTEMEVILCSAVADVLGLSEADISAEDSFFRRGGDSVAAMMLVGSLREQRCHLTVADIFEHPRLDILATKMHRALPSSVVKIPLPFSLLGDDTSSHQAVIEQAMKQCTAAQDEIEDIYPCSPLQHAFFLFSSTREKGTLIARFAYSLRPEINLDRLQKAWSETTKAHPMLRTRIIQVDGKSSLHQVVLRRTTDIEYYDSDEPNYVPDLPIEVAPGNPLLRISVVRRASSAQQQHRLVISLQHSLYDGWSRALFMQELERAYFGLALLPLPVSSFIGHLDQANEGARQFWTSELMDLRSTIFPQIPSAYTPHPSATLVRNVAIPKLASPQITLSTKIRWAWAQAISLQTSNSEVAMGLGTAGRGTPVAGIEKMVAPTMAIFPYRLHINPKQRVIDALHDSQHHYSQILPHEHYGTPNICRVATGPTSPAALQTLLIVQPQAEQSPSSLYLEEEMLPQTGAFHVRALTLHCHLQETSVETVACYDDKVISEKEMLRVLSMFDLIFEQVCQEPSMLVEELKMVPAQE